MLIDKIKACRSTPRSVRFLHFQEAGDPADPGSDHFTAIEDDFYNSIDNAVAFNLRPIYAAYREYKESKPNGFSFSQDTFAAIPPYPITWTEHNSGGGAMGCLFVCMPAPEFTFFSHVSGLARTSLSPSDRLAGLSVVDVEVNPKDFVEISPAYLITITGVVEAEKDLLITHHPGAYYSVDREGMPLTKIQTRIDAGHLTPNAEARSVIEWWSKILPNNWISFYAFNLLACRNVSERIIPVSSALQKQRKRKNRPPLTEYRILEVRVPIKQCVATDAELKAASKQRIETRFHAVRGHFAHYSEDKPLFGKMSGRFWIPAHVRGSKDAGEIKKDYRIIAPESK